MSYLSKFSVVDKTKLLNLDIIHLSKTFFDLIVLESKFIDSL